MRTSLNLFVFLASLMIGIAVFFLVRRGVLLGRGGPTSTSASGAGESKRFCTACGASNPAENLFCDKCGTELKD